MGEAKGKVALITGANKGICLETARQLGALGITVLVGARDMQRGEAAAAQLKKEGIDARALKLDVVDDGDRKAAALAIGRDFGRLDILINNAGAGNYKNLVDTSVEEYDSLMDVNMKSSFLFARHAAPGMIAQKSGEILFISSVAGLQGCPGESVYCASKWAQIGFAQSLDGELRKHGIKVGVICPGGVKTEFAVGRGRTAEGVKSSHMMEPSEVADAIVFACSQPPNARILQMTVRHMG